MNIRILSADAPKTGLRICATVFTEKTGNEFSLELATAPTIKKRIEGGDVSADFIVTPLAVQQELAEAGLVRRASITVLGSVTVGTVVRNGAREPDLESVETFCQSLKTADLIVYNTASSGLYVASVIAKLGLTDDLASRTVIVPTGTAVMERLVAESDVDAIGFGHVTEIRLHDALGTHLVGPLPGAIGRETPYAAGILTSSPNPNEAAELIAYLGSDEGKRHFVEAGVI